MFRPALPSLVRRLLPAGVALLLLAVVAPLARADHDEGPRPRPRLLVRTIAPDVVGHVLDEVEADLRDAYRLEIVPVRVRRGVEGRILDQAPRAGQVVPLRSVLRLEVAVRTAIVPDLTGLRAQDARRLLQGLGLDVEVRTLYRPGLPRGVVLRQHPAAGDRLAFDGSVRVLVAVDALGAVRRVAGRDHDDEGAALARPLPVSVVPALIGLPVEEARRVLEALDLEAEVEGVRGRRAAGLVVTAQALEPGTTVARGSAVQLEVGPASYPGDAPGGRRGGVRR